MQAFPIKKIETIWNTPKIKNTGTVLCAEITVHFRTQKTVPCAFKMSLVPFLRPHAPCLVISLSWQRFIQPPFK
jgi:hypothetical protein